MSAIRTCSDLQEILPPRRGGFLACQMTRSSAGASLRATFFRASGTYAYPSTIRVRRGLAAVFDSVLTVLCCTAIVCG